MIKISSQFIDELQPKVIAWYADRFSSISQQKPKNVSPITCKICNKLLVDSIEIIKFSKTQMDRYINELNSHYNYNIIINDKTKREVIINFCNDIFNYASFRNEFRPIFIKMANLKSCPYCNSAYVLSAGKLKDDEANDKYSVDLDHFYPKSHYPFFAITLSNIIPVCKFCNQVKSNHNMTEPHLYPYEEEFGQDASFKYSPVTDSNKALPTAFDPYLQNTDSFEIDISINEGSLIKNKIENHNNILNIKDMYKSHKNRVARIAELKQIFSEKLPNELAMTFPDLFSSDLSVLKEVEDTYFKHLTQEREILSKFHKDIIDQINKEYEEL